MYFYVWWQYRERCAALWAAAWALACARYAFLLLSTAHVGTAAWRVALQLADLAAVALLCWGAIAFFALRPGRAPLGLAAGLLAADVLWLAVGAGAGVPADALALPNRLLLGLIAVWLGWAMLSSHQLVGVGSHAAAVAIVLTGLERLAYVAPRWILVSSAYVHFGYVVAEATIAFGLFLAYFEKGRNDLVASEARFRRLAENAPDVIVHYRVTRPRVCEYCSPAIYDVLGYRPEQLTGNPGLLPHLIHPEDRRLLLHAIRQRDPARSGLLLRLVRADRATVWAELRFSYATDRGGDLTTVEAVVRDVSERARLQERLVETQQLELVAQLAGGIAHEFNNLIMAVSGHATFAAEALPPRSPIRQDIDVVIASAGKAATLTRQLLAFSRRQLLHREPLDLNEQVRQFCSVASHLVRPSVRVRMSLESGLPPIDADAGQIQEVLASLAGNASDAMPHGGDLRITTDRATAPADALDALAGDAPGDCVRLTVSDDGMGMSDEEQKHLFEPFYPGKGLTRGTGLGLASVYGIVHQHEGTITVTSRDGDGTTICICFPIPASAAPVSPPPATDAAA
jgi:PAS domain S-box-containing protein